MPVDELKVEAELHEVRDRIRMFELDRRDFLAPVYGRAAGVSGVGRRSAGGAGVGAGFWRTSTAAGGERLDPH